MSIKVLALFAAALLLAGCQQENKPEPKQESPEATEPQTESTESAEQSAAQKAIAEFRLPPFPDYPEPQAELSAEDSGVIYYPAKSPYDFSVVLNGYENALSTTGKGTLVLPEGASPEDPVPAMVLLHGSGGIKPGREFRYAELFAENGIAAFVVDYYEPRGVTEETPYTLKTMAATETDVISDAYSALKILATHPSIDADRIGVTGYSYGGMGTRYALDKRLKDIMAPDTAPFALHIDVYGPCHQNTGSKETTGAPYLAIYGDNDNSVDPAACEIVQADIREGGSSVERHIIEGAGHAWENDEPQHEWTGAYIRGCTFSFEPETGDFIINGEKAAQPTPGMSRDERARIRMGLGELAAPCIGQGYLVGSDPETDKKAKAIMLEFMKRHFAEGAAD